MMPEDVGLTTEQVRRAFGLIAAFDAFVTGELAEVRRRLIRYGLDLGPCDQGESDESQEQHGRRRRLRLSKRLYLLKGSRMR